MRDSVDDQVYQSQRDKTFTRFWFACGLLAVCGALAFMYMLNLRHAANLVTADACKSICGALGVQHFEDGACDCHAQPPPAQAIQPVKQLVCTCQPLSNPAETPDAGR